MGGCCSSSRKLQLHGTPAYYYRYSPYPEEHESLRSHDGASTVLTSGILIDLNLDMSIPDTYRSPPAPLPYDAVLGHPISADAASGELSSSDSSFRKPSHVNPNEVNFNTEYGFLPDSPKKADIKLSKSNPLTCPGVDDEDCCPTCLEEYDLDNPKITTKCNHHFHLSCILEWMERSDTCPICNQEMSYKVLYASLV